MSRELIIALLLGFPSLSLINGAVLMRNLKNFIRGTPVFILSFGMKTDILGFSDVLFVVVPNSVVILFGLLMKNLEKKGQSITSSSPELKNEIEHMIYSWKKKAIPDWK